ncbi:MAG: hypothetical protein U5L04_04400 [Trueperaceae bacterium]|nr:hypothetical protein [Trueperaceae bacterium]
MKAIFLSLLLISLGTAWAQTSPCEARAQGELDLRLEVQGYGVAFVGDLVFDSNADRAELFNGVCFVAGTGAGAEAAAWQIEAEQMVVENVSGAPSFVADGAMLTLGGWQIVTSRLRSDETGFVLTESSFINQNIQGRAASVRYDLETGDTLLGEVSAASPRYRVSGARAQLIGDSLIFEDALATTCMCEGDELYVVTAPNVSFDLVQERVVIRDGVLEIGNVDISLAEELELSEEALRDVEFPVVIEYIGDDPSTDGSREGTGLGIRVTSFRVAEGVSVEVGATGIDQAYPLSGILLLHVKRPNLRIDIGKAAEGFQANVAAEEALLPWLDIDFGVDTELWAAQDFLQQGYVGVTAHEQLNDLLPGDSFSVSSRGFLALSRQVIDGTDVRSPRLGNTLTLDYVFPDTPAGVFGVAAGAELIYYPSYRAAQYGVQFAPRWRYATGPFSANASYSLLLTNAASPFSESLDRLEDESEVNATATVLGPLTGIGLPTGSLDGQATANTRLDLLARRADDESLVKELTFGVSGFYATGTAVLRPSFEVEVASLLTGVYADADAFVSGDISFAVPAIEVGLRSRYDLEPATRGFDQLELRTSFPIVLPAVTLTPFIALDSARYLFGTDSAVIAGHGLEAAFKTCCGTVITAYRQSGGEFTTSFSVKLSE